MRGTVEVRVVVGREIGNHAVVESEWLELEVQHVV